MRVFNSKIEKNEYFRIHFENPINSNFETLKKGEELLKKVRNLTLNNYQHILVGKGPPARMVGLG